MANQNGTGKFLDRLDSLYKQWGYFQQRTEETKYDPYLSGQMDASARNIYQHLTIRFYAAVDLELPLPCDRPWSWLAEQHGCTLAPKDGD